MEKRAMVKKNAAAFAGSAPAGICSEMPETPGLKLPQGKISTATRKKLLPFVVSETAATGK
jgi:hypothetical protein